MNVVELQYAFELEASNLDNYVTDKLTSSDILYWLNQGVQKFIKTRFDGNNYQRTSFEQNEKRARDLINLLTTVTLDLTSSVKTSYTQYSATYPDDFMFMIDENVDIYPVSDSTKVSSTDVFECTSDNYMQRVTNNLTDFHLRNGNARPLRVRTTNGCNLLTDGTYVISSYQISYIRKPNQIILTTPFFEYTDFPDYVLNEIVKMAVQMYVENKKDQRYQTINNEVNTME